MSLLGLLGGGLARLLLKGFERTIARTVARSITPQALTGLILGKEPSLTIDQATALADFVKAGQRVAELLTDPATSQSVNVLDLPENPYLFGMNPRGNRVLIDGTIDIVGPNGEVLKSIDVSVADYDLPTNAELADLMHDLARNIFADYFARQMGITPDEVSTASTRYNFAERAF